MRTPRTWLAGRELRPERVHIEKDLFTFSIDVRVPDPAFGYRAISDIDGKSVWSSDKRWR